MVFRNSTNHIGNLYAWSFTSKPLNSTATLSAATVAEPTFTADLPGLYVVQLIVYDGQEYSDPDPVDITVEPIVSPNQPPAFTSTPGTQATVGQLYSYQVTATDPDVGDVLTYSLPTKPEEMTIGATTGRIEWTPGQTGGANVVVRVQDQGGLFAEQSFTITVAAASTNQAPTVSAGTPQTITLPTNSVTLNGTVTDDGLPAPPALIIAWTRDSGPGTVTFGDASKEDTTATFSMAGTYVLRLTANDGDKSAFATVTVAVNAEVLPPLPRDPKDVASNIDPTVATTTYAATQFLYTGSDPIQTGVAAGTIEPKRAAVLRGKVLDKNNAPLPAVVITVLNHPEFGQTLSRADGAFDLAVNGGGYLTLNYQRNGYLPAQRQVNVPWQDYVVLEDAVLIIRDAQATTVDLTSATEIQVARGSVVTDQDGTRQATLLIPPGTQAQV